VQEGDVVITSGLSGVYTSQGATLYPEGIMIGRVSRINYLEYEMTMSVEVDISLDFSRLEYVFVIGGGENG
jgi:rod shape-determining protein MreC